MTTTASYIATKQTVRAELAAHVAEFERRASAKHIPTGVETGIRFRAFALKGTPEGGRRKEEMTNNETVLRQNCADLQAQLAAANVRIAELTEALGNKPSASIPKRFMDQLEPDAIIQKHLIEFAKKYRKQTPFCEIDYHSGHGSRIGVLWINKRPRVAGITFRDESNFSYVVVLDFGEMSSHRATIDELIAAEAAGGSDEN